MRDRGGRGGDLSFLNRWFPAEAMREMVDLFGPFGWRIVRDGFAGEPPAR